MKPSWKALKIVLALIVMIGVVLWTLDSVRPRSYRGANLEFGVSGGLISISNPSDQPIAAQFVGLGTRTFRVASAMQGGTGSSVRVENGNIRTQQFELQLPPGTSEFTIFGGTSVHFEALTDVELQAEVNPVSIDSRRTTLFAAAVIGFGLLFYISSLMQHQWAKNLLHAIYPKFVATTQDTQPNPVVMDIGQGRAARSYGDNRADR